MEPKCLVARSRPLSHWLNTISRWNPSLQTMSKLLNKNSGDPVLMKGCICFGFHMIGSDGLELATYAWFPLFKNPTVNHSPRYTKVTMDIKFERFSSRAVVRGKKKTQNEDTERVIKEQWIAPKTTSMQNVQNEKWNGKLEGQDQAQVWGILEKEKTQNIIAIIMSMRGMHNLLSNEESFLSLWQERSNKQLK